MRSFVAAALASTALAQAPTQVQIHPTGVAAEFSVDFVGATPAQGAVQFGYNGATSSVVSSSLAFPNIGQLHAAVFSFAKFGVAADARAWYRVSADAGASWSANFTVTPIVSLPRVAVFGDFGLANDVVMAQLAADSSLGMFDVRRAPRCAGGRGRWARAGAFGPRG